MLAQNFLSHTDLDISEKEHEALIKLLGMLEREELPHITEDEYEMRDFEHDAFQMSGYRIEGQCGTAGCIAGWVSVILGEDYKFAYDFSSKTRAVDNLCHVNEMSKVELADITPAQAASALRSYLSTGSANWDEALA